MRLHLKLIVATAALALCALPASRAMAHCQIPCGIYDDAQRIDRMSEDLTTIEKSMRQIAELSAKEKPDFNQIVRWVLTKEDHVAAFSEIVTDYFMAQRIKPVDPGDPAAYQVYVRQATLLHRLLVSAMKAKQTTDLKQVEELHGLLDEFKAAYPLASPEPAPAKTK